MLAAYVSDTVVILTH